MLDPTSLSPLLDLRGLRVEVGGHVAVDGVDLVVRPGERWGLIGESGAGKSITAAVAAALPPPGAVLGGSARVGGVELVGAGEATLTACRGRVVTLVAQDVAAALHPLLPAGRQVTAALRRHAGLSRAAAAAGARELLAEVGLPVSVADARPAQLSGGQRQRVALAAALACGAPLLVADEPTAALDPAVARDLLAQLDTSLRRGGDGGGRATALLLVTHDLVALAAVCDHVAVLRDGVVVERGRVGEVLAAPHHEHTRELVEAAHSLVPRTLPRETV